jgi:sugar phosphate isomerase/epimerase
MNNRLSIDTITIRNADLESKFRLASEAGFRGIELWGYEVDDSDEALEKVPALARHYGLIVEGVCPQPDLYPWHHEWTPFLEETFQHRLDRYAQIGAGYIVLPVMSDEGDLARTAEHLARVCELAGERNLSVGLEPIGHIPKLADVEDAFKMVADCDTATNVGIILDAFHFFRGRNRLETLRSQDPGAILAVHIDDAMDLPLNDLVGYKHRLYPGEGVFDVSGFCQVLADMGYDGPYVVELLNESYWHDDPATVVRRAFDSASSFID